MAEEIVKISVWNHPVTKVFAEKVVDFIRKNDYALTGNVALGFYGWEIILFDVPKMNAKYPNVLKYTNFLYTGATFSQVALQVRGMKKGEAIQHMHLTLNQFREMQLKAHKKKVQDKIKKKQDFVKSALDTNVYAIGNRDGLDLGIHARVNEGTVMFLLEYVGSRKYVFKGFVKCFSRNVDEESYVLDDREFALGVFNQLIADELCKQQILNYLNKRGGSYVSKVIVTPKKIQTNISIV